MPLVEVARHKRSPYAKQRPDPLKLSSMPNLARAKHRYSSDESNKYGRHFRSKIKRGMSNIRTYVKSQIYHVEVTSNPSPRTSPVDLDGLLDGHTVDRQVPEEKQVIAISSLKRKLSKRFLSTLNIPGTVVVKPELRRPPSIQTMLSIQSSTGATSIGPIPETPPTSEGTITTGSPGSIRRYDLDLPLLDQISARKLSTIPELDKKQMTTVKTCEATAAAKIFLETRYHTLMYSDSARKTRAENLEQRLSMLRLPPYLKHRIRRA